MLSKFLSNEAFIQAGNLLGDLEVFTRRKVFHCVRVYLKDYKNFDWSLVVNLHEAQTIPEDSYSLMFLRSLCDGIINSVYFFFYFLLYLRLIYSINKFNSKGKNLREEVNDYHKLYKFKNHQVS